MISSIKGAHMGMRKNNQLGMGTVEILLIVVIVAVLGFVGWFIYDKKKDANKTLDQASQSNSQTSEPQKKAVNSTKYLEFKELSVKIPHVDTLKNTSYEVKTTSEGTSLFLNDSEVAKMIDACSTQKGSNGNYAAIGRAEGTFPAEPEPGVGLMKQFDTFYITGSYPNGAPCEDESANEQIYTLWKKLQAALSSSFKNGEKI